MIAVYDEILRTLTVHKLDTVEDLESKGNVDRYQTSYGTFKPCYKINNFWMLKTDFCIESGNDSILYLAR